MQSVYLIVFTVVGGLIALFVFAGWSSYTEKKIPELSELFRSFLIGTVATGLASYTWLFGFNGDVSRLFEQLGGALEVKETLESLTNESSNNSNAEIKVGMPSF
jgi:hypothetical protein